MPTVAIVSTVSWALPFQSSLASVMPPAIRGRAMATSVPKLSLLAAHAASLPAASNTMAAIISRITNPSCRGSSALRCPKPNWQLLRRSGLDVDVHAVCRSGIVDAAHGAHIDTVGRNPVIDQHLADGKRALERQPAG